MFEKNKYPKEIINEKEKYFDIINNIINSFNCRYCNCRDI